jgi:hypothetical protein
MGRKQGVSIKECKHDALHSVDNSPEASSECSITQQRVQDLTRRNEIRKQKHKLWSGARVCPLLLRAERAAAVGMVAPKEELLLLAWWPPKKS